MDAGVIVLVFFIMLIVSVLAFSVLSPCSVCKSNVAYNFLCFEGEDWDPLTEKCDWAEEETVVLEEPDCSLPENSALESCKPTCEEEPDRTDCINCDLPENYSTVVCSGPDICIDFPDAKGCDEVIAPEEPKFIPPDLTGSIKDEYAFMGNFSSPDEHGRANVMSSAKSVQSCAEKCSQLGLCSSFEFDDKTKDCYVHAYLTKPNLAKDIIKTNSSAFYRRGPKSTTKCAKAFLDSNRSVVSSNIDDTVLAGLIRLSTVPAYVAGTLCNTDFIPSDAMHTTYIEDAFPNGAPNACQSSEIQQECNKNTLYQKIKDEAKSKGLNEKMALAYYLYNPAHYSIYSANNGDDSMWDSDVRSTVQDIKNYL